eukprot:11451460-Alexandrium_andersonii.AAC.1
MQVPGCAVAHAQARLACGGRHSSSVVGRPAASLSGWPITVCATKQYGCGITWILSSVDERVAGRSAD